MIKKKIQDKNKVIQGMKEWIIGNKRYLFVGIALVVLILFVYSLVFSSKTYAINTLDSSYYECPEGTVIFDTDSSSNNHWVCYVNSGVKGICPLEKQTNDGNGTLSTINDTCSTNYNEGLTTLFDNIKGTASASLYNLDAYYGADDKVYVYNSTAITTTENTECNLRNYVNTPEDDNSYYGYYNSACVCYGSSNNNSFCHLFQMNWLDATNNVGGIYRYYIPTTETMSCDVGEAIVIGSDPDKGDLYACSLQDATLKKRNVTLNFSFSDNGYTKSSMTKEFEVANGGGESVNIDNIGLSAIDDAGYEFDLDNSTCTDTKGLVYHGSFLSDSFVVNGSSLDSSQRFLENITCNINFKRKTYYVKVTVSDDSTGSGSITSSFGAPDSESKFYVTDGEGISVDAIADSDSKYVSTTCESKGGVVTPTASDGITTKANIAFSSVYDNVECSVRFAKKVQYKVTASVSSGSGTVSPLTQNVNEGTKPVITFTPDTGYAIDTSLTSCDNGEGNYSISGSTITITKAISSNVSCQVYFKAVDYTVTITSNPTGGAKDISIIYNGDDTDLNPNYGDNAVVTVTPNDGYDYTGNTCGGGGSNIEAIENDDGTYSFEFTVEGNKTCQINFSKSSYTVSANMIAGDYSGGAVKVNNSNVEYGGNSSITVTNPTGYSYDPDNTTCSGTATIVKTVSPITISNVWSNVICSVAFKPNSYTVSVTPNDINMGSVSQSKSLVTIHDDVVVTVTPQDGYEYITNNCGASQEEVVPTLNSDGDLVFTLSNISSNRSCQVTFGKKVHTVSASVSPTSGGSATVGSGSVEHDGSTTITLTPNTGYVYDSHSCKNSSDVSVTSSIDSAQKVITVSNITDDVRCVVNYKLKNYSVVVTPSPTDGVVDGKLDLEFDDGSDDGKAEHGSNVLIHYEPMDGYHYSSNTCGAREYSTNQLIIENVTSDIENCVVTFLKDAYTVSASVSSNGGGSVSVSPNAVDEGGSSIVRATPSAGYVYDSENTICTGTGVVDKDTNVIQISEIGSNVECVVAFKLGKYSVDVLIDEENAPNSGTILKNTIDKVTKDDSVVVTVTPNDGFEYESNDCGANGSELPATLDTETGKWTFTINGVTEDKVCHVHFMGIFKVSATAINGKIDGLKGSFDNGDGTVSVYENRDAEISISPNDNYVYASNDCGAIVNSDNSKLTIANVREDKVCKVIFEEKKQYKVDVTSSNTDYGTVSPSSQQVYDGGSAKVVIKVTDGNEYLNVTCNDKVVEDAVFSEGELVISNVHENLVCVVNYKDVGEYTVTSKSSNEAYGQVTPDTQTVSNGANAEITLVPNDGYEYVSNDCGAEITAINKLTLRGITSNRTCIVTFKERDKHTITAKPNDENAGSVIVSDDTVYNGGDTTLVVVPNDGYEYVSNDCGAEYSNGVLLLSNVTSDKICTVHFKSNILSNLTEDIKNVQTGDKSYMVYLLCVVGVFGVMFGYKKIRG